MKWMHECSLDWLKARTGCLTATDVKELLPITKTGRKRTITEENYVKVLAGKLREITKEDCLSTGAAARGHILEPFAIDEYNAATNADLHHWDDAIIVEKMSGNGMFVLGFSPDSADIPQPGNAVYMENPGIREIGEVKCYAAERHLLSGFAKADELEERWQIATAMAVAPTIEEAHLIFFNPSMATGCQLFAFDYSRADLATEVEMIRDAADKWLDWANGLPWRNLPNLRGNGCPREGWFIDKVKEEDQLNPFKRISD